MSFYPLGRHFCFILARIFVLLGLLWVSPSMAENIWSKSGKIPTAEASGGQMVFSLDGRKSVIGTENGLLFDGGGGRPIKLPVVALAPLWEVVWAPNSLSFAVNASDGGAVGTWDTTIFELHADGAISAFFVSSLVRRAASQFARCDSPEVLNVALVGWEGNGAIAHVVAEVPPHSSCKNMGSLQGYRIDVKSKKILGRLSDFGLRKRWRGELGSRFI
jgi:hypothetical protein